MARLIDADDLLENAIDYVDWYSAHLHGFTVGAASEDNAFMRYNDIISAIKNVPTIDAAPVVHGEWMQEFISKDIYCSNCKREIWTKEEFESLFDLYKSYCPCCGAKMD